MPDTREHDRVNVNYPAYLERTGHFFPCTVVDVARKGAKLCISPDMILPGRVNLWFTREGDLKRLCRIVWRKKDRVGVRFIEAD